MRPVIGLIPAAGRASRLGSRPGSKELALVLTEGSAEPYPVATVLLDAMGSAGIANAYIVLRIGKWDIPAALAGTRETPSIAYLVTPGTASIPETLDVAYPFVREADVALGFPDVRFTPPTAMTQLLTAHRRMSLDLVLGLFPSSRPDKTDMVEVDGDRVTGFRIKPGPCELTQTWILAAWGPRFTEYLHAYLATAKPRVGGDSTELQISEVLSAALGDGFSIGGFPIAGGHFIDIGTPDDLARAGTGSN